MCNQAVRLLRRVLFLSVPFLFLSLEKAHAVSPQLDSTFAVGSGAGFPSPGAANWGQVQAVAVQPDGKVLAGGQALFTNFNGTPIRAFCRINTDGSLDTAFLSNLGAGTATSNGGPGEINSIAIQPDGKILIAGDFASVDGLSRVGVARLNANGSVDTGFMATGGGVGGFSLRYVRQVILQPDGKILVVGGFTSFSGTSRPCVARLNSDGTLDATFAPGFPTGAGSTFGINAVGVRADGKIYVGGSFTNWLGQATPGLVRLESNGALDTSFFPTHKYPYPSINCMSVLGDGRLLVGGFLEGTTTNVSRYFARLNNDGSIDNSYPAAGPVNGLVMDIKPWPGGGHLISGRFRGVGGQLRGEMALLDAAGNLDSTFAPPAVPNSSEDLTHVYTIDVAPDGKIVFGGWFTNYPAQSTQLNGQDYSGIGRLIGGFSSGAGTIQFTSPEILVNEDAGTATVSVSRFGNVGGVSVNYGTVVGSAGASDFTATSGTLSWASGESGTKTFSVTINSDAVAEGLETFTVTLSSPTGGAALGTSSAVVTIVDDDSAPIITTQPQNQSPFIGFPATFSVSVAPGLPVTYQWRSNNVDIVGATNGFFTLQNVQTNFAASYSVRVTNAKGFTDSAAAILTVVIPAGLPEPSFVTPGVGFNQDVYSLAFQTNGQLLVGGGFSQYGGVSIPASFARLNVDGSRDTSFPAAPSGANSLVQSIGVYPDGKLLIAGAFTQYSGTNRSKLARLNADGSLDLSFSNATISATIYAAIPLPDGGAFIGDNGIVRKYLPNGTNDTNFASITMLGQVYALARQADGKILAAPYRTTGGIFGTEIVRLNTNGSRDITFTSPGRFNSPVQAMAVMPDGRIVLAGGFTGLITEAGTNSAAKIAMLNPDGSVDSSFDIGTGPDNTVISLAVQADGRIVVGGAFSKWNGITSGRFARLMPNGALDCTFIVGTGANDYVRAIAVDSVGHTAIGGTFTQVNGQSRGKVALLTSGPGAVQFTVAQQQVMENSGSVTVSVERVAGSRDATTVNYSTSSGTAISGTDFSVTSGSLTWTNGEAGVKTFTVPLINDASSEADKIFSIGLSGLSNGDYGIFTNQVVEILDDESTPRISLQPASVISPEDVPVTFTVAAYSALPFTYQWRSNTVNIANATNASFTLQNVQSNFVANYSVRLSNANGFTDSSNAALTVIASPTRRDSGFVASPAFNNSVRAIFPLGDGRVLVGGDFTQPQNKIVLLNANGTVDASFTNTATGSGTVCVYDIERDGQGRWLIAGQFSQFAGVTASNLVRLNPDFSLDTNFLTALGAAPSGLVRDVSVAPDGKIWIGGDFSSVGGPFGLQKAARLFPDGSIDLEFLPRAGINNSVYRIVPLTNGGAMLGGTFSSYDSSGGSFVRVLPDGRRDTTFNASVAGSVYDILPLPHGGFVVSGEFSSPSPKMIKLNATGGTDTLFLESVSANGAVNSLARQSNGRIVAVGAFTTMGSHSNRFTRINVNGTLDNSINVGSGFSAEVYRVALEANGQIWVGGSFTQYKGAGPGYLVRLVGDEPTVAIAQQPLDRIVAPGGNATFWATAIGSGTLGYQWLKNGAPLVDGGIVSGATTATLTLTGISVSDEAGYSLLVTNDSGASAITRVAILSVQGAPTIFAQPIGGVIPVGGKLELKVAATGAPTLDFNWFKDGSLVSTAPIYVVTNASAGASGNYQVIVSNSFGAATSVVASVSVEATPASAANGFFKGAGINASSTIFALQTLPDGRLLVGGTFNQLMTNGVNPVFRSNLGLFNTNGMAESFNPSPDNQVTGVFRQRDGKILVAGNFNTISNVSRRYLARFNADFTFDTNFHTAMFRSFNTNGPDAAINYISVQADGKILIAGGFTTVNGVTNRAVARLNPDGSVDSSFTSYAASFTSASVVEPLPDGRIVLLGGGNYGGHSAAVYRLNADGSVDKTFTNSLSSVTALAVQTNGAILVGGTFTTANNMTRPLLARLVGNGQLDTNFLAGVTNFSAYNQAVIRTIAIQDNGKILAGGNFLTFGPFRNGLARFNADGSADNSFIFQQGIGDDYNANVWKIALFADGRIAVGGQFATWEGVTENSLAILNGDPVLLGFASQPVDQFVPNGTTVQFSAQTVGEPTISYQWFRGATPLSDVGNLSGATTPTLTVANASQTDAGFYSLQISNSVAGTRTSLPAELFILAAPVIREQPLGGTFYVSNSLSLHATILGVAPISYQWLLESNVIANATNSFLNFSSLALTNSGNYQLIASNNLGAVTSDVATVTVLLPPASLSPTFGQPAGAGGPIYSVVPLGDGRVVIGGQFSSAGKNGAQIPRANMALLNTNGTADATFDPAPNGQVNAIVRDAAGGFLVGGFFQNIGGQARNYFARLNADGSLDTNFLANLGSGPNQFVYDVALQSDGKILLAGSFSTVSGQSYPSVVRLNSNGAIDSSFRVATSGQVQTMSLLNDGRIYIGGFITLSNRQNIVRLNSNGSVDLTFMATANSSANRAFAMPDGGVVIGGFFNTINGNSAQSLARLNADGTLNTSWPMARPDSSVEAIALQSNGKLIIGGQFFSVGGQTRNRIARYNADGSLDDNFASGATSGFNQTVRTLALESDGRIWVGGNFTTCNGAIANSLALLAGDPVTPGTGSPFENWAAEAGLTPANNAPNQDADNDGVLNVFEFYFGTAPLNAGSFDLPSGASVNVSGQNYPAITFVRVKNIAGVTLIPQASSSVTFSDSLGVVVHSVTDLGDNLEQVTIRSATSDAAQPTQFLRIQLSIP